MIFGGRGQQTNVVLAGFQDAMESVSRGSEPLSSSASAKLRHAMAARLGQEMAARVSANLQRPGPAPPPINSRALAPPPVIKRRVSESRAPKTPTRFARARALTSPAPPIRRPPPSPGPSSALRLPGDSLFNGCHVVLPMSGLTGVVRWLGETEFAPGFWVGVELDHGPGRNNGTVAGVRYFQCDAQRGLFVRPSNCHVIAEPEQAGALQSDTPAAAAALSRQPSPHGLEGAADEDPFDDELRAISAHANVQAPHEAFLADETITNAQAMDELVPAEHSLTKLESMDKRLQNLGTVVANIQETITHGSPPKSPAVNRHPLAQQPHAIEGKTSPTHAGHRPPAEAKSPTHVADWQYAEVNKLLRQNHELSKALEHVQQIAVEAINALERERKEKDAQIRSLREQVQRREISRNFGRAR